MENVMIERRDVEFAVEAGDHLRGWLFWPEAGKAQHPAVSMAHGYAGVKERGLERTLPAFGFLRALLAERPRDRPEVI
jgi:uncharacterized protein